jgi:hypothetical protein
MRGLPDAMARTSTTPSAVSHTGRISVTPGGMPSTLSQCDSKACSACICAPAEAIGIHDWETRSGRCKVGLAQHELDAGLHDFAWEIFVQKMCSL